MSEKNQDPSFIDLYAQERNKPTTVLRPEDILDQRLPFQIRALRFREAVEKAEKMYQVKIIVSWIWSCDDDQMVIEDQKEPHGRLYYETLRDNKRFPGDRYEQK